MVRFLISTVTVVCLASVCSEAQEGRISDNSGKPQASAKTSKSGRKDAKTLVGAWKGTFTRTNPDGGVEANEYVVRVSPDYQIEVVRVSGDGNNSDLQPTTGAGPVSGSRNGEDLEWQVVDVRESGEEKIDITKKCSLRLEKDGRHAAFTYDILVVNTTTTATENHSLKGSGRLSRSR